MGATPVTIIARSLFPKHGTPREVQLVDPSAFTPPYDRALAAALARAGAEVELLTSRFLYGPVPAAEGYGVEERLLPPHRRARPRRSRAAAPSSCAEHLPDMLRLPPRACDADVVHYQWLTVPGARRPAAAAGRGRG